MNYVNNLQPIFKGHTKFVSCQELIVLSEDNFSRQRQKQQLHKSTYTSIHQFTEMYQNYESRTVPQKFFSTQTISLLGDNYIGFAT